MTRAEPEAPRLRIAMALYADVTFDSRVQREAATLAAAGHDVTIYALAGSAPSGAAYAVVTSRPDASAVLPDGSSPFLRERRGSALGRVGQRLRWVVGYARNLRAWGRWTVQAAGNADVWHAHDLTGLLAVGPVLPQRAKLIYDSHEIFMETGTAARLPGPFRALLARIERRLVRRALAMITVNDAYAAVLARRLRPRRVLIVRNCPPRWQQPDKPTGSLRQALGLPQDAPIVLYHGSFTSHRGIEQLAEAMLQPELAAAHLVLLGFGQSRDELARLAAEARFGGRIHVLDAVAPEVLLDWISDADVDAIPLQRSTLNHWLCTPNKLWESIAAGVPVVVSDFPSMRPIVSDDPLGPLGEVCDAADPASIARAVAHILNAPPEERARLRARCSEAARDRWNWERESATLVDLYDSIRDGEPATAR